MPRSVRMGGKALDRQLRGFRETDESNLKPPFVHSNEPRCGGHLRKERFMSEERKNSPEAVETPVGKDKPKKLSRRKALLAGLLGAGAAVAKTAEAAEASCACLAAPDCDAVCPNGGTPRGDGTQACECNEETKEQLATVAYTGKYSDLIGLPKIPDSYTPPDIVTAGTAGQSADLTIKATRIHDTVTVPPKGSFKIPYFSVDKKGRITSFTTHTVTLSETYYNYYNYYNYSDYSDYNCNDAE